MDNATLEANAIKDLSCSIPTRSLEVEDIIAHAVEVSQTHYMQNLVSDLNRINVTWYRQTVQSSMRRTMSLGTEEMDGCSRKRGR